jgi:hypothetical protein
MDADINIRQDLNSIPPGGFVWNYDTLGSPLGPNEVGFYDNILHELGHAHLLNHVNDINDVMYYNTDNVTRTNLDFCPSALAGATDVVTISPTVNLSPCLFIHMIHVSPTCSTNAVPTILENVYKLAIFPNPINNGDITISYQLNKNSYVQFKIMDCTGREVMTQDSEKKSTGTYTEQLNIDVLAEGIYLLAANINGEYKTVKFIKL